MIKLDYLKRFVTIAAKNTYINHNEKKYFALEFHEVKVSKYNQKDIVNYKHNKDFDDNFKAWHD